MPPNPSFRREVSLTINMPGRRFREDAGSGSGTIIHKQLCDTNLAARLAAFCHDYRIVFNVKLAREIRLLEGPLLPMLMLPECRKSLDFRVRHKYFDLCLSRLEMMPSRDDDSQASEREPIYISIHRDSVLEDTAEVFHSLSPHDLMTRDLEIEFDDEDGIDAGGLTREWYMLVCRAIFKEEYGLFAPAGDGVTYMPSPSD